MVDKYQGTYLSPDDFNMAINTAQRQYLSSILSESADIHQGGKRIKTGLKSDMTTNSSLTIFIKEATLTITSQLASHPNDMYDILAIRTIDDNYAVKQVSADKIPSYIGNAIDAPTLTEPIYTEIGATFKFFPSTLSSAKIVYVKTPVDAAWVPDSGTLNYNSGTSTQLEWSISDINEIVYRALGIIGINLKDGDLIRVSQTVKNDGQ